MGLDMYLRAKKYIGGQYEHNVEGRVVSEALKKLLNIGMDTTEITFHVHDWRKANAIHRWFVDNVQDGEDDCKEYYVSIKQLEELFVTCKQVMEDKSKAPELLPTQEGFFFGGTEYDDNYFSDVEETIKVLSPIVVSEAIKRSDLEYYYSSSW